MYGHPNQFNMIGSARMGSDEATPADSFQGGIEDLEAALMESQIGEMDELQTRQQANQGGENDMLMQLMQMLGGMG